MQNNVFYTAGSSIYPGEYVPRYGENDFNKIGSCRHKKKTNDLHVNIDEQGNFYIIELPIPGVERENLFVKVTGNILSVSVIYDNNEPGKQKKFQLHEFTLDGCFCRNIVLPENADPIFMSAECRSDILKLYVPKSRHPATGVNTKIAVY